MPLSGYLWGLLADHPVNPGLEDAAQTLCRAYSVFHWWLAFPQVAAKGGFSVMLGNPPWERIKLQEEEFFATRSPLVATARNKHERGQRIEWLREGMLLHQLDPDLEASEGLSPPNRAEMALYDAFIAARRQHSRYRDGPLEGVVVRVEDERWLHQRAKLVRPDFTQHIESHWRNRTLVWNHLAANRNAPTSAKKSGLAQCALDD